MTTLAAIDPQLKNLSDQILAAFSGGSAVSGTVTTAARDVSAVASSLLEGYHIGVLANPAKAPKGKAYTPQTNLSDLSEVDPKSFWGSVWDVVRATVPVVVNALSKDFKADAPKLSDVVAMLPEARRSDQQFQSYATQLLLASAQGVVQAASGQKDFSNPHDVPVFPELPPGVDKNFWSDAWKFVQDAAPVVIPAVLAIL